MHLFFWVVSSGLLTVWAAARDEEAPEPLTQRLGPPGALPCSGTDLPDPRCPRKKKAATLVPSFTKTTPHATTHHLKTTPHPTTHPANHTTVPANHTTPHPTNHTIPFHTTAPVNHTTAHPTNHTTAHPTNHTIPFHTTTPISNTTAHPANHTTAHHHANHTTPPAVVTTAPLPTDTPLVAVGNYMVKNGSTPCLRLEAGLQFRVTYTSKTKHQLWGTFALQPNHTNASGSCSGEAATIKLRFPEGFLIFIFKKNETEKTSYLTRVQANLTYQFLQATETSFGADSSSLREFETSLGHSYQCQNRTLTLADGFQLQVLKERVQAFELQGGEFGEAEVCTEQRRSPVVVIIVVVVLVLLIVIVLVAYAVGRRRSQVGYQTL
ncbi:macrosialin [Sphaerodactylus townsendi]|uniref:Uncharacterized protein n=1 Tax=Sphaerodactylus townsendi TaxID=933632 RepID=A0ACB8EX76_9SAUR|nr:macrosialin [Sphaerodactylus townsendi]